MHQLTSASDDPSEAAPSTAPLQTENKGVEHQQPYQVGGDLLEADKARMEEAERQHAEFGVVGWVENDESNFDNRHSSHNKPIKTSSYFLSSSSSFGNDEKHISISEEKENDDSTKDLHEDGHIEFSNKLYGREKELVQLELIYQQAMGLNEEEKDDTTNSKNKREEKNQDGNDKGSRKKRKKKSQGSLQVVFLKGFSGSGKTALVNEAVERIQQKFLNPHNESDKSLPLPDSKLNILIHGKYDLLRHAAIPYKALTLALKRWYHSLSHSEKQALVHVQHDLENAIGGDDQQNLSEILPFLSKIITGYDAAADNDSTISTVSTRLHVDKYHSDTMNKARVHFAFQSLFRSLCRHSAAPLILFLDDLQWADSYSLDLLASLLSPKDRSEQHVAVSRLLFVGAYRENEVTPLLQKLLDTLHNNINDQITSNVHNQPNTPIITIAISDLGREQLGKFVADTLQLPPDDVLPLTNVVFEKTMGNMYYARQALEELVRQNALYYDMMTFQWQWAAASEEKLAEKLTSDISEMVRSKIQALPVQLHRILVSASYLGQHFDVETLIAILNALQKEDTETQGSDNVTSLVPLLDLAVKEGLLATSADSSGNVEFSFAHDRVQEVAQSMALDKQSDYNHEQLMIIIGNVLVEKSTTHDNDVMIIDERSMFFLGMHHLNMAMKELVGSQEEVIRLAQLNLHASRESISEAAFESAMEFSKQGIGCMNENYEGEIWQSHRGLMHELHKVAAEACRLSGDLASMEAYCKACLAAEHDRPLDDLFPIYFTLANGLIYGTNRLDEAKAILLKLLAHLGCKIPRTTIGKLPYVLKELLSLALFKRRLKPGTIENMGFVHDSKQIDILRLLQKLGELTYMTSDELTMVMTRFGGVSNCLKHGMSVFSAGDVASIAIILIGPLNDLQSGRAYAQYGLKLMDRVRYKPLESIAHFVIYYLGLYWTSPVAECIRPLRIGYQTAINTGMTEHATWCACGAMMLGFQAGQPLAELDSIWIQQLTKMEGWGHTSQTSMFKALSRVVLAVRGVSRDDIPPLEDFSLEEDVPAVVRVIVSSFDRLEWALLGEHELCANRVVQEKDALMKAAPANPTVLVDLLYSSLSCWHMYRTTRKNKYGKEARRIYRWIFSWAKQGNPNVLHWIALFDAEKAFIKHRAKAANENYRLAIKLALDGGFKHDAAIFYERWAVCTLDLSNNKNDEQHAIGDSPASKAAEKMQEAVRLYSIWGAFEIVRRLKDQYPALLQSRSSSSV